MSIEHHLVNPKGEIIQATEEHYDQLEAFFRHNHDIHRHLDWFGPLDWLGQQPFLLKILEKKILAALCAVPENAEIAWIRAFGVCDNDRLRTSWAGLLKETLSRLRESGIKEIVSLALHKWYEDLLIEANFRNPHNIIVMKWRGDFPAKPPHQIKIRSMIEDDLEAVENIDQAAFSPIWQNSLSGLRKAYHQPGIRTVALQDEKIIGYQISTTMAIYGHLARLAVHPEFQEQGIGYALVYDLLKQFTRLGFLQITVNTQSNNLPSHILYKQMGFFPTGDEIPVYTLAI